MPTRKTQGLLKQSVAIRCRFWKAGPGGLEPGARAVTWVSRRVRGGRDRDGRRGAASGESRNRPCETVRSPFGVRAPRRFRTRPRGCAGPSHGVPPTFRALLERSYRGIWVARSRPDLHLAARSSRCFERSLPPMTIKCFGFELSWSCVPFGVRPLRAAASLSSAAPPLGFAPLQRLRTWEPTMAGFASSDRFRLQGSLALLTACFSRVLHGRVSCRARSGFTLRSVSLHGEGAHLSMRSDPRAVGSTRCPASSNTLPGCRVLLAPEVRCAHRRVVPAGAPRLPWASPLQGFPPGGDDPRPPANLLSRTSNGPRIPLGFPRVSLVAGPVRLRGDHRPS